MSIQQKLDEYCIEGNLEKVKEIINGNKNFIFDFSTPCYLICRYNHKEIVEYFIDNTSCYIEVCLRGAIDGKHKKLIEWIIEIKKITDYNIALLWACAKDNKEIVEWLIFEKGANNFSNALIGTYISNSVELAKWLIDNFTIDITQLEPQIQNFLNKNNIFPKLVVESD